MSKTLHEKLANIQQKLGEFSMSKHNIKAGDTVICIDNEQPDVDLEIGGIYIAESSSLSSVIVNGYHYSYVRFIKGIHDCKLNRVLYPELKPDGKGFLV